MPTNVIPGAEVFQWKDLVLHGNLTSLSDSRKRRVAVHEYLKRDGGEVEDMGRSADRFKFTLVFVGDGFRAEYQKLQASIDEDPKGLLIHPLLGAVAVHCEGTDNAAMVIDREVNSITVPISFIEDRLNRKVQAAAAESQSVSGKEAMVTMRAASLRSSAAAFSSAVVAAALIETTATTYAAAASAAARTHTANPALGTMLASVAGAVSAFAPVVLRDPVATASVVAFTSLSDAELVYDACLQLSEAIDLLQPPIIEYVVPGTTSLASLTALLYGKDAIAHMEEVLSLNAIPNPSLIQGGTRLRLYSPRV